MRVETIGQGVRYLALSTLSGPEMKMVAAGCARGLLDIISCSPRRFGPTWRFIGTYNHFRSRDRVELIASTYNTRPKTNLGIKGFKWAYKGT